MGCLEPLVLLASRLHHDIEYLLSIKGQPRPGCVYPDAAMFQRSIPQGKIQPFLCKSRLLCSLTGLNLSIRGNKLSYSPSRRCQFEFACPPPPMQSGAGASSDLALASLSRDPYPLPPLLLLFFFSFCIPSLRNGLPRLSHLTSLTVVLPTTKRPYCWHQLMIGLRSVSFSQALAGPEQEKKQGQRETGKTHPLRSCESH